MTQKNFLFSQGEYRNIELLKYFSMTIELEAVSLTDRLGVPYLGFKVSSALIAEPMRLWELHYESLIGVPLLEEREKQQQRDGGLHHITLLSVPEIGKVDGIMARRVIGERFSFSLIGIGRVEDRGGEAQYIVGECMAAQSWRESLGVGAKDMHITLGFSPKDIFTKGKGRDTVYIEF